MHEIRHWYQRKRNDEMVMRFSSGVKSSLHWFLYCKEHHFRRGWGVLFLTWSQFFEREKEFYVLNVLNLLRLSFKIRPNPAPAETFHLHHKFWTGIRGSFHAQTVAGFPWNWFQLSIVDVTLQIPKRWSFMFYRHFDLFSSAALFSWGMPLAQCHSALRKHHNLRTRNQCELTKLEHSRKVQSKKSLTVTHVHRFVSLQFHKKLQKPEERMCVCLMCCLEFDQGSIQ